MSAAAASRAPLRGLDVEVVTDALQRRRGRRGSSPHILLLAPQVSEDQTAFLAKDLRRGRGGTPVQILKMKKKFSFQVKL